METKNESNVEKKKVSREQFYKKVEAEAAHLMYFNGMSKEKADRIGLEVISKIYAF